MGVAETAIVKAADQSEFPDKQDRKVKKLYRL
jgi:hypothetical protein